MNSTSDGNVVFFTISAKSFEFSAGYIIFLTPAIILPAILYSKPPIAVAFPCRSVSPVIAIFRLIGILFSRLYIAIAIASPAEDPFLLTAPTGQCV